MTARQILALVVTIFTTNFVFGQNQNDQTFIKKKHLQYLIPILDGRKAKMKILFGDLNGDGVKDAFIDWCIEATEKDRGGGTYFWECMKEGFSVYIKHGNKYLLTADKEKNSIIDEGFSYKADKIENGKIICSNISYAEDDPNCCPSLKREIYLIFKNNKIIKPNQTAKVTKHNNLILD